MSGRPKYTLRSPAAMADSPQRPALVSHHRSAGNSGLRPPPGGVRHGRLERLPTRSIVRLLLLSSLASSLSSSSSPRPRVPASPLRLMLRPHQADEHGGEQGEHESLQEGDEYLEQHDPG